MLQHTFCHIQGIGLKTEKKLWQAGITTWERLSIPLPVGLPKRALINAKEILQQSTKALADDPVFFTNLLGAREPWRIFPHFRHSTVYLDIESTGCGDYDEITTISTYDGEKISTYVNGINLDDFVDDITQYQVIVSYNGKNFDIPFLERYFRIKLKHAQIDLRYVLAGLGLKGGLKGCEKQLGIHRGNLDGMDGSFAISLWHRYQNNNDKRALETLLAYNIEDTVNLERLAVEAYNRNVIATPFADQLTLPFPDPPAIHYQADHTCIEAIKRSLDRR